MEKWKPITGYDRYEVSDQGRIRGPRGVTAGAVGSRGYRQAYLRNPGQKQGTTRNVHVLVAEAFIGPRPPGLQVCHNDGNKNNNTLSNLRYDTPKANWQDFRQAPDNTTHAIGRSECPRGHPLEEPNLIPSQSIRGWRSCLSCSRAAAYVRQHPELKYKQDQLSNEYYEALKEHHDSAPPSC